MPVGLSERDLRPCPVAEGVTLFTFVPPPATMVETQRTDGPLRLLRKAFRNGQTSLHPYSPRRRCSRSGRSISPVVGIRVGGRPHRSQADRRLHRLLVMQPTIGSRTPHQAAGAGHIGEPAVGWVVSAGAGARSAAWSVTMLKGGLLLIFPGPTLDQRDGFGTAPERVRRDRRLAQAVAGTSTGRSLSPSR